VRARCKTRVFWNHTKLSSMEEQKVKLLTQLTFDVAVPAKHGDKVYICGSTSSLGGLFLYLSTRIFVLISAVWKSGNWDPERGVQLHTTDERSVPMMYYLIHTPFSDFSVVLICDA
jgi:hypothetical protein